MNLRLRIPPAAWLLLFGGLMWALHRWIPLATLLVPPANRSGWLLAAGGGVIIATGVWQFRRARTTFNPYTPAKTSSLVSSGLFGYSRNPMYLGFAFVLAGWATVLGSASPWLALPPFVLVITRLQIEPEEAVLGALFGQAYADYCARVGRWFGRRD